MFSEHTGCILAKQKAINRVHDECLEFNFHRLSHMVIPQDAGVCVQPRMAAGLAESARLVEPLDGVAGTFQELFGCHGRCSRKNGSCDSGSGSLCQLIMPQRPADWERESGSSLVCGSLFKHSMVEFLPKTKDTSSFSSICNIVIDV